MTDLRLIDAFMIASGYAKKREAVQLIGFENAHFVFDEMILRASKCISSHTTPLLSHHDHNALLHTTRFVASPKPLQSKIVSSFLFGLLTEFDYNLMIIGTNVGGHGVALHVVENLGTDTTGVRDVTE